MGNSLSEKMRKGTIGELLVQLRLLECEVQSAPPIRDSGNDLIAIKGEVVRFIQVKTTTTNKFNLGKLPQIYHIIAFVRLYPDSDIHQLDKSEIFLLEKEENKNKSSISVNKLKGKELTKERIDQLFKNPASSFSV